MSVKIVLFLIIKLFKQALSSLFIGLLFLPFFCLFSSEEAQALEIIDCIIMKEQTNGLEEQTNKQFFIPIEEKLPVLEKKSKFYKVMFNNRALWIKEIKIEQIPIKNCFAFEEKKINRKQAEILMEVSIFGNQSADGFQNIVRSNIDPKQNIGSYPDPIVKDVSTGLGYSIGACNRLFVGKVQTTWCLDYMEESYKLIKLANPYQPSDNKTTSDLVQFDETIKFSSFVFKINGSQPFKVNEHTYFGLGLGLRANYYFNKPFEFYALTGNVWKNTLSPPIPTGPKGIMTTFGLNAYYERLILSNSVLKRMILNLELSFKGEFGLTILFGI